MKVIFQCIVFDTLLLHHLDFKYIASLVLMDQIIQKDIHLLFLFLCLWN